MGCLDDESRSSRIIPSLVYKHLLESMIFMQDNIPFHIVTSVKDFLRTRFVLITCWAAIFIMLGPSDLQISIRVNIGSEVT